MFDLVDEDIAMVGPEHARDQGDQPGVEGLGLVEPAGHLGRVGHRCEDIGTSGSGPRRIAPRKG